MFLYASAPIMKFGRGFEVNMQALEEALSSDRPSESELLSLVHSRLLCTRRELKGLKPGEMKYPFSWCMERLQERLADWYRRRAVLRELIFEAERSDDEEEIAAGVLGGGVTIQQKPKQKPKQKQQKAAAVAVHAKAGAGAGAVRPAAASAAGGLPLLQQQAVGTAGGGGQDGAQASGAQEGKLISGGGAGATGVPLAQEVLPNGVKVDPMDVEEEVATAEAAVGATPGSLKQKQQQDSGGGVEESKGGEEPGSELAVAAVQGVGGAGGKEEEASEVSKRVSATQCKVCNTRGTVTDMVKCIYEGCGGKYHLRCLLPVVDEVPKGQWYCPDCREKKRVFGCNGCMQNDRPSKILQCDGPKCGLEYHYGCLDPPLDKVPTTKWWYCPDCVRTDNQVGCRVCKNDVDYDKLLKCDGPGCELEWHTYCLKPPINIVPKGDFFCPYCKAKQKVDFEKKRQQDIARANERRRRREARKAQMAAADSDDDVRLAYGRPGVAGLRGALLAQYEDLEPDKLRLELHRINILLTRIEEAREASDALAAAAAAAAAAASTAGGSTSGDGQEAEAVAQASHDSGPGPAVDSGDVDGDGGVGAGTMGDGSPKKTRGGVSEAGGGARPPLDGGVLAEEAENGAAATDADADTGIEEGNAVKAVVPAGAAGADGGDVSGTGGNGEVGEGSGGGGGNGSGGGESVPNETDPVAAFWAALAAAESAPTDGSGIDGEAEDGEEDGRQRKQQQQRLQEEEEVDGAWGGAGDSPLAKGRTYESLSVPLRVAIVNALCEEYMDDEDFRSRIIDETDPEFLRRNPIGEDSSGRLYYHFPVFRKEMRVYRTVETNSSIPPVDKVATELTGGGTLEAAAEAAADRKSPRVRGGSEMELVADSLEGMERLLAALSKSKSKSKEDDVVLHENLAVEVEEMKTWVNERMEKEEKKRLADEAREKRQLALEAQPRRRSGRLVRAAEGWAVAELEGGQEGEEEEEEGEDAEAENGVEGVEPLPDMEVDDGSGDGAGGDSQLDPDGGRVGDGDQATAASPALDVGSGGESAAPVPGDSSLAPMDTGEEGGGQGHVEAGGVASDGGDGHGGQEAEAAAVPESNDGTVCAKGGPTPTDADASDETAEASTLSVGQRSGDGTEQTGHVETAEDTGTARAVAEAVAGADGVRDGSSGGTDGGANGSAQGSSGVDRGHSGASASVSERPGGDDGGGEIAVAAAVADVVPEAPPAGMESETPAASADNPTDDALDGEAVAAAAAVAPAPAPAAPSSPPSCSPPEAEEGLPRSEVGGTGGTEHPAQTVASVAAGATLSAPVVSVSSNGGGGKSKPSVLSNGNGGGGEHASGGEKPSPEQVTGGIESVEDAAGAAGLAAQENGPATAEELSEQAVKKRKREPDEDDPEERESVPKAQKQEMSGDGGATNSASQSTVENGHALSPAPAAAAAGVDAPPSVGTPPLHGLVSNGALDIMALAASSRPRATTPSSSQANSPSRDRSGSGSSGGGGGGGGSGSRPETSHHPISPRGVSSALDIMAAAVEARKPAPLPAVGGSSGDMAGGASDGDSPAQRAAKKPRL
ncbi:unnamed protein product [Scytosiphon promiscuus]